MALEALVGGKRLWPLLDSAFTSGSLPLMTTPLPQTSLTGTIT
jgi:hypothetical protein